MFWLYSGSLGFTCWIYFASVFSLMYCWVLIFALCPYKTWYIYVLYVLDDAWISEGSFMQTKHLCVLIYIWTKGEVGNVNWLKPSSKILLLIFRRWLLFCGSYFLFMLSVRHVFLFVHCWLVVTCWESADLFSLVCDVLLCFCQFPMWYPGSGVLLDCINSWSLPPFFLLFL